MKHGFWALIANHKTKTKTMSLHALAMAAVMMMLSACGGSGGDANLLGGGFALGEVRTIEFDAAGRAGLPFSGDLSGGEEFAVALFAAEQDTPHYQVEMRSGSFSEADFESAAEVRLLDSPSTYLNLPEGDLEDATAFFHQRLREDESLIAEVLQHSSTMSHTASGGAKLFGTVTSLADFRIEDPWYESCAGGRGMVVKILNSTSRMGQFDYACAERVHQSAEVNYYVDENDLGRMPLDKLLAVIENFESKLPVARNILGALEPDADGNGRFEVVFSGRVNALGANSGGYITGFFHGENFSTQEIAPGSNEKDVLFMSVPDAEAHYGIPVDTDFYFNNIACSTLIHEYQHAVNYGQKVLLGQQGAENATLNEGLSHALEGLCESNSTDLLAAVGKENYSRINRFLSEPNLALMQGTALANRGGMALFVRYLYEQANLGYHPRALNGAELIQNLVSSPERGIANLEQATGVSFERLLSDFYVALILNGQGFHVPERYRMSGIDYGIDVNDGRGTALQSIHLQDLTALSLSSQVPATGGWLSKISGQTAKQSGQNISLLADPHVSGVMVRIQ